MYVVKAGGIPEETGDLNLLDSRSGSLVWPCIKRVATRRAQELARRFSSISVKFYALPLFRTKVAGE